MPASSKTSTRLKKPAHRVALAFPTRSAHFAAIVQGIADYARQHGNWAFTTGGESFELPLAALRRWQGEGVIAALDSTADAAAARRLRVPVVNFVSVVPSPGIPKVLVDHAAVGAMAANHLLERGFRQFAFYGFHDLLYSTRRHEAFARRLAERGFTVTHYLSPSTVDRHKPWEDELVALARWIGRLPVPLGIFAANDTRARLVIDACRLAGREVPREIGVIGVDNFQIACEFGSPTLSSIACDWTKVGFDAAALLDRLMRGRKPPATDRLIPPVGVVPRESTNVLIIGNPLVARAVAYARDNLSRPFGAKTLAQVAGVSRRTLELGFAQALGASPAEFLLKLRVDRALEQLSSESTLTRIAKECGFSDLRQFRRALLRFTGATPRQHLARIKQAPPARTSPGAS